MRTLSLLALGSAAVAVAAQSPPPVAVKGVPATKVATPAAVAGPAAAVPPGAKPATPGQPAQPAEQPLATEPVMGLLPFGPAATQAVENSPRMKRLKAMTFDRRPTAMLKAWAPRPANADPEAPEQPSQEQLMMMRMRGMSPNEDGPSRGKPAKKSADEEKLDKELDAYQKAVVLGNYPAVKAFYGTLTGMEAKAAYAQILRSLSNPPPDMQAQMRGQPTPPAAQDRHTFVTDDLIGLCSVAPAAIDKDQVRQLAGMLSQALQNGVVVEHVVDRLKAESAKRKPVIDKRQAARLLAAANQLAHLGPFLPDPAEATKAKDLEALNLLARHFLEKHAADKKSPFLEKAWEATVGILALEGSQTEKDEAIKRAVELAPRIKQELGQAWLDDSYTKNPDRGKEILAALGSLVSRGIAARPYETDYRVKELKLLRSAIDALLKADPKRADEWSPQLTVLAGCWLKEAEYSKQYDRSTGMGTRMRRDYYGNYYFMNADDDDNGQQMMMMRQQGFPAACPTPEVLRAAPTDEWLKRVDAGLRPKLSASLAGLYLKVSEEEKAFPFIERLAPTHPDQAKALVKEFLRVWTRNHDPNAQKNEYRNSWIYFYGYESRAESIPLTRSKQERNLQELAKWVARLRTLNLGDIDEDQLAKAFTACHSSAEVYKTEAIETVFGPMGTLKPKTLGSLAQTMRGNLAGLWRLPSEQEKKKTKRKQKDIESEVNRGYRVALATVEAGLKRFPDHYALTQAKAALLHDQVNFEQEISKAANFTERRTEALNLFATAADQYRKLVESRTLTEDEETTDVYDQWFYAGLGAVDLGQITEEKQPDYKQPPRIKAAMAALPADAAKRHADKFANALFTRMSSAKPQVKFRYLKAGFAIVDPDHKQAAEAKKVYDYYADLVTEIKLDTEVDGNAAVGHGRPFGVFVNLRHTRDIERESGGFGRYLQNQNSLSFSYNYGRPTADYRDRFETAAKEALKEHFEVVSVTFQNENVHSRAHRDFGWRVTPYAYLLLKPRGPQVDKLPPLRLDLDFLDTSGYVVLPVDSPTVPIDCRSDKPASRPLKKLTVTQTLDERQADKGKLLLEVKASGVGLVGPLDELLTVEVPGFERTKTDDNGITVTKFDEDGDHIAVVSERSWTVAFQAKDGEAKPTSFKFASAKVPVDEMTRQRFQDADMVEVKEETASLEREYARRGWGTSEWLTVGAAAGFGLILLVLLWRLLTAKPAVTTGPRLPDPLTPFAVVELLRRARAKADDADRAEIDRTVSELEAHYFADRPTGAAPDLRRIAERWVRSV